MSGWSSSYDNRRVLIPLYLRFIDTVPYVESVLSRLVITYQSALVAGRSRMAGQGLAEYALILALIAIVAIIALLFLGGQVSKILSRVGNSV